MPIKPLPVEQLSAAISLEELPFDCFDELPASDEFLGQPRAKKALAFGLLSKRVGYNLFVMGDSGTGRISMVMKHLQDKASLQDSSADWIYVNNFEEVREPWAIELPTGQGKKLVEDCRNMVNLLVVSIPAAFENPDYRRKKTTIDRILKQRIDTQVATLEKEANQKDVALYQEANNISFSPIIEGKAVDDITFASLTQEKRDQINQTIDQLEEKLSEALLASPQWSRESYDALQALDKITLSQTIEPLLEELESNYQGLIGPQIYFDGVRKNLVDLILEHFNTSESSEPKYDVELREFLQNAFIPNLLVTNFPSMGAPVVYETHPTYTNLFGRIEYRTKDGAISTSFQQIRSGALHRANGGYLLVEVQKLYEEPYVWGQLKQALQTHELKFEPPAVEGQSMVTIGLNPHAVPLKLKVILVGNRESYDWLKQQDPEFNELFRVLVDFDGELEQSAEVITQLAQLVKSVSQSENFAPISRLGFVELVNFSARFCGHQKKLSARFGELIELLGEANILREIKADQKIESQHIIEAQNQREFRHSRIRDRMLDSVLQGQIIIKTDGSMVGSVNGLTIWQIGSTEFGTPARITATVFPGTKGIVDIERESELGLSLHSKGVMILSGYLANQYAKGFPFTLSANIVMEQSYGLVDGDSASLSEVCALISAITKMPIKESFSVTGSINQFGDVQAVDGVNEKIEGFYLLCKARGLTGDQGVIIPTANLANLMLKEEVTDSVANNQFNIYSVESVDQAIELLCVPRGTSLSDFKVSITEELKRLYHCSSKNNHQDIVTA